MVFKIILYAYYSALHIACEKGFIDIVILLLQKHFIRINCRSIITKMFLIQFSIKKIPMKFHK